MTAIVGWVDAGKVHMGCDSLGSNGHRKVVRKDCKMFRTGDFLIGYTSSYRMGQLLQYSSHLGGLKGLTVPTSSEDLFRFMVNDFIERYRAIISEGGYKKTDNSRDEGVCFLVGVKGRLFRIAQDFQVGESAEEYDACGCGEIAALAILDVFKRTGKTSSQGPAGLLSLCLGSVSSVVEGVAGPFHFEVL